jgi:hypothetical protein
MGTKVYENGVPVVTKHNIVDSTGAEVDFSGASTPVVTAAAFVPRVYASLTPIALSNVSDTSLYSFSSLNGGALQAISVRFSRKEAEIVLNFDGVEAFRLDTSELGAPGGFDIPNALGFPIRSGNSDSHVLIDFGGAPVGFNSGFELLAQRLAGPADMDAIIAVYREAE